MKEISLADVEKALKTVAATALKNEQFFSELDSYAGDGDFGQSLAGGFRVIESDWAELDHSSIGNLLLKISMVISKMMIVLVHSGAIGMPEVTSGQDSCEAASR